VNWNKLDKCWKEFAENNNADLKYGERNLFHAIKCEYEFIQISKFWKTKFIGILWKSQQGHNKDRTNISTKFIDKESEETLNINNSGIRSFFTQNKLKGIEEDIYQDFKNIGGKKLNLDGYILKIELDKIITKYSEFEQVTDLLNVIKNYRQHRIKTIVV
jgi:hypothetical protein